MENNTKNVWYSLSSIRQHWWFKFWWIWGQRLKPLLLGVKGQLIEEGVVGLLKPLHILWSYCSFHLQCGGHSFDYLWLVETLQRLLLAEMPTLKDGSQEHLPYLSGTNGGLSGTYGEVASFSHTNTQSIASSVHVQLKCPCYTQNKTWFWPTSLGFRTGHSVEYIYNF